MVYLWCRSARMWSCVYRSIDELVEWIGLLRV